MQSISEEECQVVVISRGTEDGARKWREKTGCTFPIYLDPSRELYTRFDMRRSVLKVFCPDIMRLYVKMKLSGATFPDQYPGDDVIQIGGDVVLNNSGEIKYTFHSKTAVDRLDSESILKVLKELKNQG